MVPIPAPPRRDRLRVVGIVVTAVIVVASTLVVAANASGGDSIFPKEWDARVAPVAAKVAVLRDLNFKHAVPVKFLSPKEFEKEVGVDEAELSEPARQEIEQQAATLRAAGLIGGDVDLLKAIDTSRRSSTLALYSFRKKQILVRGSTLDAQHRATLAHELVHVLQDQHFDLEKLQRKAYESSSGDTSVFTALAEGDARRIEEQYVQALSKTDQAEYDRVDAEERARVGRESGDVPDIVEFVFGAPYTFGPATAKVLASSGGARAIDRALVGPVPSSRMFLQPGAVTAATPVAEPIIPVGATPGPGTTFGAFELYTVLGAQIDASRALHAADAISGGSQASYTRDDTVCVRVELAADRDSGEAVVRAALSEWAKTRPANAHVEILESVLGYKACDPGAKAPAPASTRFSDMSDILGLRTGLTIGAAQNELDGDNARCTARLFITHTDIVQMLRELGAREPNAQQTAAIRAAAVETAAACKDDSDAGLP